LSGLFAFVTEIFRVHNEPMSKDFEIRQGFYLPHWRQDEAIYHVVFRLHDSVPANVMKTWVAERDELLSKAGQLTEAERARARHLVSERTQDHLDAGHGDCILGDEENAAIVAGALAFFDGKRYHLHAWCVMPNHVHVIVEPFRDEELSKITHSWKSFTAHEIRKRDGESGNVWHRESYDHIIRNERSYQRVVRYVLDNPLRAGLRDWKWVGLGSGGHEV
jgi:REP element-mobilizing transposase RayT